MTETGLVACIQRLFEARNRLFDANRWPYPNRGADPFPDVSDRRHNSQFILTLSYAKARSRYFDLVCALEVPSSILFPSSVRDSGRPESRSSADMPSSAPPPLPVYTGKASKPLPQRLSPPRKQFPSFLSMRPLSSPSPPRKHFLSFPGTPSGPPSPHDHGRLPVLYPPPVARDFGDDTADSDSSGDDKLYLLVDTGLITSDSESDNP